MTNVNISLFDTKNAIRVVCKSNFLDHTSALFMNTYTLPLFDLINSRNAIFMYIVYYDLLPFSVWNIFHTHHLAS